MFIFDLGWLSSPDIYIQASKPVLDKTGNLGLRHILGVKGISSCAEVNAPDFHGQRPLHQAVVNKSQEVRESRMESMDQTSPKSLKQRQVPGEYDKKCLTYPNMKYPIDKDWIRFKLKMNDVLIANIHSRHQVLKDFFEAGTSRKMPNIQGVAGTFESQCRRGCAIHWFQADWGATWCYFEGCNMAKGCKKDQKPDSLTVVVWCCLFMISLDCRDAWYNRILGSWTTGALGTAFVATGPPRIAGNGYGNHYP